MISRSAMSVIPAPPLTRRVLVLNRLYLAVRIAPARRAFQLLAKELAEVISVEDGKFYNYSFASWLEFGILQSMEETNGNAHEDWIHTVQFAIPVPRIIRLLTYDRLPQRQIKLNRRNILARDHFECQYCQFKGSPSHLTIDHVIPRSRGGQDTWNNLVTACRKCNSKKGGRLPHEAGMPLLNKPKKPKVNPLITARLATERYECWDLFLRDAKWPVDCR